MTQQKPTLYQRLCGEQASIGWLIVTAAILCLAMLGTRELWTQEGRWGSICWEMMITHNYFHPSLYGHAYYDKPLLSYWLQIFTANIFGVLNAWTLRLPSAITGIIGVWAIYRIGYRVSSKREVGLVAGWLLTSTFFYIFWARVASADIFNVTGIMLAIAWYFEFKDKPRFSTYAVFFIILAITSLFKGIVADAIVFFALLPDLLYKNNWKKHVRISVLFALIPAAIIYLAPFIISSHTEPAHYNESGLVEVFRENVKRYFDAWDHKDPFYSYFLYLPLYVLPWIFFFIPAIVSFIKRWKTLAPSARWSAWAILLIFVFMSFSESRRNYYTLMMTPFALLMTAQWITAETTKTEIKMWTGRLVTTFAILLFLVFGVVQPIATYNGPLAAFTKQVKTMATQQAPWQDWQVVLVNGSSKMPFYFKSPHKAIFIDPDKFENELPKLNKQYPHMVFIARSRTLNMLEKALPTYTLVVARHKHDDRNYTLGFVPNPELQKPNGK